MTAYNEAMLADVPILYMYKPMAHLFAYNEFCL